MNIKELKWLLKDKRVQEEIHKHLWIESQKAGYDIGIACATDEWLRLYSEGWMKHHMPEQLKKKKTAAVSKTKKKKTTATKRKKK